MRERIYFYPSFKTVFVILGLMVCGLGVYVAHAANNWFVLLPFLAIGIALILSMNEVVIDYSKKSVETNTTIYGIKYGHNTIDLSEYDTVSIVFHKERTTGGVFNYRRSGHNASSNVTSFEMYVYGFLKAKTYLCEFGSHAEARRLADKMAKHMNFKIEDSIADGIALYKKNPWKRRR